MKVFASGSCRLLTSMRNGHGKIEPIHSMFHNFIGINFLGKLHNTKQHIQFIKWINDEMEIPQNILSLFLTSYGLFNNSRNAMESLELNPIKKKLIKDAFNQCEYYIFEICSIKLYKKDGYQIQHELTNDYEFELQSETDLNKDLKILRDLIPKEQKIIFQTHFRPNIIYNDVSKIIDKREIIYNAVKNLCDAHDNTYLCDPSVFLNSDKSLFDGDTHFNNKGYEKCFNYIYDNFMNKIEK